MGRELCKDAINHSCLTWNIVPFLQVFLCTQFDGIGANFVSPFTPIDDSEDPRPLPVFVVRFAFQNDEADTASLLNQYRQNITNTTGHEIDDITNIVSKLSL